MDIDIRLKNVCQAFYHPGQLLEGTIELRLDQSKIVKGFYFIVRGEAYCKWDDDDDIFEGREYYMNTRTYLYGSQRGNAVDMPCGIYRYKFEYQLPRNIPASFEGSHGHVRYNIEACLDMPWHCNERSRVEFSIVRRDDLNENADLKAPNRQKEIEKFFCPFSQSSKALVMTASIPHSGFVPGQIVPVTVIYDNQSGAEVDKTKINLKKFVTYYSQTPAQMTKKTDEKIMQLYGSGVDSGEHESFTIELRLPVCMLNSCENLCKVISISYELKVEAEISGLHQNVKMIFPITIGSITFAETTKQSSHNLNQGAGNIDWASLPRQMSHFGNYLKNVFQSK